VNGEGAAIEPTSKERSTQVGAKRPCFRQGVIASRPEGRQKTLCPLARPRCNEGPADTTWGGADDDFLVARLGADLTGAERVDMSVLLKGVEVQRMQDIPVNAQTGNVLYQESIGFAKTAPTNSMVIRLLSVEAAGERVLGEYTFHHTRTIAGPPGWEI
jgi:hypothetical protein